MAAPFSFRRWPVIRTYRPSSCPNYAVDQCGNFFIYIPIQRLKKLNEIELNRELSDLIEEAIGYFDLAS